MTADRCLGQAWAAQPMSVLTNLLPGLRDLRAPLSAGFIWLFVIYLAVAPLPADPHGLIGSVDDLRNELGPVAQTAALTFVAYVLGSFVQAIVSIVVGVLRPAPARVSRLTILSNIAQVSGRSRAFESELRDVAHTAAREALSRLETRGIDLPAGLATLDWARSVAKAPPVWRIAHVDVSPIGASDEAEHDIARKLMMHEVDRNKEAITELFGVDGDRFEHAVTESGASHVSWLAGLFAPLLADRLRGELEQIRTRLLVDQPELFSKVDRLQAEAEFRAAIAPALVGVAAVLVGDSGWLALAILVMALALLYQGISQSLQSDAALVEALRIGRASSPSLDQVRALGTDQWVADFWRVKAPEQASANT